MRLTDNGRYLGTDGLETYDPPRLLIDAPGKSCSCQTTPRRSRAARTEDAPASTVGDSLMQKVDAIQQRWAMATDAQRTIARSIAGTQRNPEARDAYMARIADAWRR